MKILFLCTANIQRSRTAEDHFRENYPEHSYKSAGLSEKYCSQHDMQSDLVKILDTHEKLQFLKPN